MPLSSGKSLPRATPRRLGVGGYLRIGEVAQLVGISSSALRSWEALGLIQPQRSRSRYRLYTQQDVQLLKRAYFWRRVRGLNPAAIIHLLKRQGRMRRTTPAPRWLGVVACTLGSRSLVMKVSLLDCRSATNVLEDG